MNVRLTSLLAGARGQSRALALPLGLVAVAYLVIGAAGDAVLERVAIAMFINLVVVVALYMFTGLTGVLSFGHIGFMAIGAYVGALLTIPPQTKAVMLPKLPEAVQQLSVPTVPAALLAGLAAALVALVLAAGLMRLAGLAAGIATLAVLMIVSTVVRNWDAVTRGTGSMLGIPTNTTLTTAFAWAVIAIVAASLLRRSGLGLRLQASREDAHAAAAVGVNIVRDRSMAFVISAFVAGVGGFLFAQFLGVFGPDSFYIPLTFLTLAMLVVGGMTSLSGAVAGVIVISIASEVLIRIEQDLSLTGFREIGLALIMLAVLIALPEGLAGLRRRLPLATARLTSQRAERGSVPDPALGAAETD